MQTGWQQEMPTLDVDYGDDAMSEWLDIGPTVEEEDGWGVEESDFTTSLDYSRFTPEQIRQAQAVAAQISREQKQYGESRHFDKNMRDRRKQQQVKHDAAVGVNTAEDAIELLRRQKERQAAAPHQQYAAPAPQNPGYNEPGAVGWLRTELEKCANNIRQFGEPPPQHAARFLLRFGQELLQFLPNPPADVKAQVLSSFASVGWDVRIRQPLRGSHPPNGQQLTSVAFGLCCFFSHRNQIPLPPPEMGIITHIPRPAAQPPQPRPQQHHNGGKGGRGGKGGGKAANQHHHNQRQHHGGKGDRRQGGHAFPAPKPRGHGGHGGGQQNPNVVQPRPRGQNPRQSQGKGHQRS